jgi:hypothetical protein
MSTRSFIGMVNRDLTITSVYCHWDGYVEYNGKMLLEHYNTPAKVRKLLHKGDFSALKPNISEIEYYVDRGDEDTGAVKQSLDEFIKMCKESWGEYFYVLKTDGTWAVSTSTNVDTFRSLEEVINVEDPYYYDGSDDRYSDLKTVDIVKSSDIIDCEGNKNNNIFTVDMFLGSVRNSIVNVEFEKADGSLTERYVTLAPFLIPSEKKPKSDEKEMTLEEMTEKDYVRVFSITDNDWRTVKPSKIKNYSKPEVEFTNKDGKFVLSLDME